MNETERESVVSVASVATDVERIRQALPGQLLAERLQEVTLRYGRLYSLDEIRIEVGKVLPRKPFKIRGAALENIERYTGTIPEDALLKYDEALRSGLFSGFLVATPTYYATQQTDPWILGEVKGVDVWGSRRLAVIAQWD
jgi:hypothetical protein